MTTELYATLAPAVTVHGRGRRIDQRTAPPLVLQALPNLTDADLKRKLEDRSATQQEVEGLNEDEAADGDDGEEEAAPGGSGLTGVGATRRRARTRGAVTIRAEVLTEGGASAIREALIRLGRTRQRPYQVLVWRRGERRSAALQGGDEN